MTWRVHGHTHSETHSGDSRSRHARFRCFLYTLSTSPCADFRASRIVDRSQNEVGPHNATSTKGLHLLLYYDETWRKAHTCQQGSSQCMQRTLSTLRTRGRLELYRVANAGAPQSVSRCTVRTYLHLCGNQEEISDREHGIQGNCGVRFHRFHPPEHGCYTRVQRPRIARYCSILLRKSPSFSSFSAHAIILIRV